MELVPGDGSHAQVGPVHERDAVCETGHSDQAQVDTSDDFLLLFGSEFFIFGAGALGDILDAFHAGWFLVIVRHCTCNGGGWCFNGDETNAEKLLG